MQLSECVCVLFASFTFTISASSETAAVSDYWTHLFFLSLSLFSNERLFRESLSVCFVIFTEASCVLIYLLVFLLYSFFSLSPLSLVNLRFLSHKCKLITLLIHDFPIISPPTEWQSWMLAKSLLYPQCQVKQGAPENN